MRAGGGEWRRMPRTLVRNYKEHPYMQRGIRVSHPRRSSDGSTGARASASRSNVCWMMALSDPSLINVSAEAHNDPIQTLKP